MYVYAYVPIHDHERILSNLCLPFLIHRRGGPHSLHSFLNCLFYESGELTFGSLYSSFLNFIMILHYIYIYMSYLASCDFNKEFLAFPAKHMYSACAWLCLCHALLFGGVEF